MVLKISEINYEDWSKSWRSSKQPRKQRKYIINAPLHIRRKIISSTLSEDLKKLLKIRSLPVIVGDYVKVLRGDDEIRNKEGFVVHVDTKHYKVYIDTVKFTKKDGKEVYRPIHYSKLMILKLNLSNKNRIEIIKRKMKVKDESIIDKLLKDYSVSSDDLKKVEDIRKAFK